MTTWADIQKAKRLLDWEPEIEVEEGLRKTIDWYFDNKDWIRDIKV